MTHRYQLSELKTSFTFPLSFEVTKAAVQGSSVASSTDGISVFCSLNRDYGKTGYGCPLPGLSVNFHALCNMSPAKAHCANSMQKKITQTCRRGKVKDILY